MKRLLSISARAQIKAQTNWVQRLAWTDYMSIEKLFIEELVSHLRYFYFKFWPLMITVDLENLLTKGLVKLCKSRNAGHANVTGRFSFAS